MLGHKMYFSMQFVGTERVSGKKVEIKGLDYVNLNFGRSNLQKMG